MLLEKRGVIILISTIITTVVMVLLCLPRDRKWYCTTHDNETGVCVAQSACGSNTDRLSPEVAQSGQLTQCKSTNSIIYVCCKQNRVTDGKTSPRPTKIIPTTERQIFEPNTHAGVPKSDEEIQYGLAILLESECEENKVSLSERPWMASLVYEPNTSNDTQRNCTGSLITNQYVLTAAHCIYGSPKVISVRLGGNPNCVSNKCVESSFQDIDIEEAIYHDNYIPDLIDDIGLIRLTRPADMNFYVRPICLPLAPEAQNINLEQAQATGAQVTGWDIDVRGDGFPKKAVVHVKDNDYCQQIFKTIRMTENLICAIGGSHGSESVGLGGALYAPINYGKSKAFVQFGILTSGDRFLGHASNCIYSRITYYLLWIAGNVRP